MIRYTVIVCTSFGPQTFKAHWSWGFVAHRNRSKFDEGAPNRKVGKFRRSTGGSMICRSYFDGKNQILSFSRLSLTQAKQCPVLCGNIFKTTCSDSESMPGMDDELT